jgi:hypothetical protein
LFEDCGWDSCAAAPSPDAISSARVVKTILLIFDSFSERPHARGAKLRASVLIGLLSVIIAYRFGRVASPYS